MKPASHHYYQKLAKSIIDTLPLPIASRRLPQVTVGDLRAWRDIYAASPGEAGSAPPIMPLVTLRARYPSRLPVTAAACLWEQVTFVV